MNLLAGDRLQYFQLHTKTIKNYLLLLGPRQLIHKVCHRQAGTLGNHLGKQTVSTINRRIYLVSRSLHCRAHLRTLLFLHTEPLRRHVKSAEPISYLLIELAARNQVRALASLCQI